MKKIFLMMLLVYVSIYAMTQDTNQSENTKPTFGVTYMLYEVTLFK